MCVLFADAGSFLQLDLIREVPIPELTRRTTLPLGVKDEVSENYYATLQCGVLKRIWGCSENYGTSHHNVAACYGFC